MATSGRMAMQPKPCMAKYIGSPTYFYRKPAFIRVPSAQNWCEAPLESKKISSCGPYVKKLQGCSTTPNKLAVLPVHHKAKYTHFVCSAREPRSMKTLSSWNEFGTSIVLDQFPARAESLLSGEEVTQPKGIPALSRRRVMRRVDTRASRGLPYSIYYPMTEKKPRWWWRTLACIPYLMPLHVMSIYAEGAQQFLPFLENFEILTDPIFGTMLPAWCTIFYCLGVYFLVVRRKTWPHFFRFHVVLAMLLDNAIQIIGIVAKWMPYWSKLDTPFWTVVACGLLLAMVKCIRAALRGTYPDIPFFSEAALMHAHLP